MTRRRAAAASPTPPPPQDEFRGDSVLNLMSGLGDPSRDKGSAYSVSQPRAFAPGELEAIYCGGTTLAARLIDLPVDESVRAGWRVTVDADDDSDAQPFAAALDALGVRQALAAADRWALLYGGAAIVLDIDDGGSPQDPVNEAAVRRVRALRVVDRHELTALDYYRSGDRENGEDVPTALVGEPKLYHLSPVLMGGASAPPVVTHASRVIRYIGFPVPNRVRALYDGWGMPALQRYWPKLVSVAGAEQAMGHIMQEWRIAILRVKGLAELASSKGGSERLAMRLAAFNLSKSVASMGVIDKEEEFIQQAAPVTGLVDLYYAQCQALSAISGIPVTILYGEAPQGLATDNESGRRAWYDHVSARQVERYEPALRRICRLLQISTDGGVELPDDTTFKIEFAPLHQPTDAEQATARKTQAETDKIYWEMNVIEPEELRQSRFGGIGYSADTRLMTAEERARVELGADGEP